MPIYAPHDPDESERDALAATFQLLQAFEHPFLDGIHSQHPPGLGTIPNLNDFLKDKVSGSRPGTPAIPPGLAPPEDFPPLSTPFKAPSQQEFVPTELNAGDQKKVSKAVVPVVPQVHDQTQTLQRQTADHKQEVPSGLKNTTKQEPFYGELNSRPLPHAHEPQAYEAIKEVSNKKRTTSKSKMKDSSKLSTVTSEKHQNLGNLHTGAAKDASEKQYESVMSPIEMAKPETPKKIIPAQTISTVSQPQTPATTTSQTSASPVVRSTRTLRLLPTPKTEAPSTTTHPTSTVQPVPTKSASRQASVASFNLPDTPVNDTTPDNVSSTSASVSRPTSPHPGGKVGTAPVRQKTKSQAKKDRQARAKAEETKIAEKQTSNNVDEEPVQAPIVGRKKKTKKQPTQDSVEISQPSSPAGNKDTLVDTAKGNVTQIHGSETSSAAPEASKQIDTESKVNDIKPSDSPLQQNVTDSASSDSPSKSLTPASILAEMKANGEIATEDIDPVVNFPTYNHRFDSSNFGMNESTPLPSLSELQINDLEDGSPVILKVSNQEYAIVLPDHAVLRHLSHSEAEKYIRLRKAIAWSAPDFFTTSRLPSCMSMRDSWDDYSAYGPPLAGQDLMYSGEVEDLSNYYGSSILRISDSIALDDGWGHRTEVVSEDVVSAIDSMKLNEAEVELKRLEDNVVGMARKEADAMEKKLSQTAKKNRKVLRDVLGS